MATYLAVFIQKPTLAQLQSKINNTASSSDVIQIQSEDSKAIGIDKSREIIKFAQKKPMAGEQKLAVVYDAGKMTEEAQNAMLKTLEEHPAFLDIVLVAKNENGLLETVLSRCKKIRFDAQASEKSKKKGKSVLELKSLKTSERLGFAQKIAKMEKEELVELLEEWAIEEEKNGFYRNAQHLVDKAHDLEKISLNTRLAIETLFLQIN